MTAILLQQRRQQQSKWQPIQQQQQQSSRYRYRLPYNTTTNATTTNNNHHQHRLVSRRLVQQQVLVHNKYIPRCSCFRSIYYSNCCYIIIIIISISIPLLVVYFWIGSMNHSIVWKQLLLHSSNNNNTSSSSYSDNSDNSSIRRNNNSNIHVVEIPQLRLEAILDPTTNNSRRDDPDLHLLQYHTQQQQQQEQQPQQTNEGDSTSTSSSSGSSMKNTNTNKRENVTRIMEYIILDRHNTNHDNTDNNNNSNEQHPTAAAIGTTEQFYIHFYQRVLDYLHNYNMIIEFNNNNNNNNHTTTTNNNNNSKVHEEYDIPSSSSSSSSSTLQLVPVPISTMNMSHFLQQELYTLIQQQKQKQQQGKYANSSSSRNNSTSRYYYNFYNMKKTKTIPFDVTSTVELFHCRNFIYNSRNNNHYRKNITTTTTPTTTNMTTSIQYSNDDAIFHFNWTHFIYDHIHNQIYVPDYMNAMLFQIQQEVVKQQDPLFKANDTMISTKKRNDVRADRWSSIFYYDFDNNENNTNIHNKTMQLPVGILLLKHHIISEFLLQLLEQYIGMYHYGICNYTEYIQFHAAAVTSTSSMTLTTPTIPQPPTFQTRKSERMVTTFNNINNNNMSNSTTTTNVPTKLPLVRIVYIISTYTDIEQLKRLVDAIYLPQHIIIIHIDIYCSDDHQSNIEHEILQKYTNNNNIHMIQFGAVIYRTDSISLINIHILYYITYTLQITYDYVFLLDGLSYPLVSKYELLYILSPTVENVKGGGDDKHTVATVAAVRRQRHVYLGQLYRGKDVTGQSNIHRLYNKRFIYTTRINHYHYLEQNQSDTTTNKLPLSSVYKLHIRLPHRLFKLNNDTTGSHTMNTTISTTMYNDHMNYKSTSGNQGIYSRTIIQDLLSNDKVLHLFIGLSKYSCCCCIEEHNWIAAIHLISNTTMNNSNSNLRNNNVNDPIPTTTLTYTNDTTTTTTNNNNNSNNNNNDKDYNNYFHDAYYEPTSMFQVWGGTSNICYSSMSNAVLAISLPFVPVMNNTSYNNSSNNSTTTNIKEGNEQDVDDDNNDVVCYRSEDPYFHQSYIKRKYNTSYFYSTELWDILVQAKRKYNAIMARKFISVSSSSSSSNRNRRKGNNNQQLPSSSLSSSSSSLYLIQKIRHQLWEEVE